MKLRCMIVDDERLARARLRRLLEDETDVDICAECGTGTEALAEIAKQHVDVLFLDIQMPGMDGFSVMESAEPLAPLHQPMVVFVTAHDEHAVRAFDACALDYLLKPVAPARLQKTLERLRASALARPVADSPVAMPQHTEARRTDLEATFVARCAVRVAVIRAEEIDWVESAGNYAILHTATKNHMIRDTMAALETKLPEPRFLRVSRSAIVNLLRVKEIRTLKDGDHSLVLHTGSEVPMTRGVREVERRMREAR